MKFSETRHKTAWFVKDILDSAHLDLIEAAKIEGGGTWLQWGKRSVLQIDNYLYEET